MANVIANWSQFKFFADDANVLMDKIAKAFNLTEVKKSILPYFYRYHGHSLKCKYCLDFAPKVGLFQVPSLDEENCFNTNDENVDALLDIIRSHYEVSKINFNWEVLETLDENVLILVDVQLPSSTEYIAI